MSEELDATDTPATQMSRRERSAAWLSWRDSHNHYEEYADQRRLGLGKLVPSLDLAVSAAIVVFFLGSYAGFIVLLAVTR